MRTIEEVRRLILVCEASGGGVGKHVLDLAEHLPALGFDVLLIVSLRRAEPDFIERLTRHAQFGYHVARVDVDRAPGAGDLRGAIEVRRAIRAFGRADVLHGHSAKGGALARLARWGCARRVFYTPHAFYAQSPTLSPLARRAYAFAEYLLGLATDHVIATSRQEFTLAREIGIPEHKLTVIENGIARRTDAEVARARALARRRLGYGADDLVIGFVGRLVPQKAPRLALDVFRQTSATHPDAHFVIAGDGPEGPALARDLRDSAMMPHVRWLRRAAGSDLLPAFDVLVVTSRYEGFPYVMLEALDSGCAIVSTNVGGAEDCIRDGEQANGAIVSSWSTDAITRAVVSLCRDRERLAAARRHSRDRGRLFDLDQTLARHVSLYREQVA